jgi:hypothetical protein
MNVVDELVDGAIESGVESRTAWHPAMVTYERCTVEPLDPEATEFGVVVQGCAMIDVFVTPVTDRG